MKNKIMIIASIILALATVAMAWISNSDRFGVELHWFVITLPVIAMSIIIVVNAIYSDGKKK